MRIAEGESYVLDVRGEVGLRPEVVPFVVKRLVHEVEIEVEFPKPIDVGLSTRWEMRKELLLVVRPADWTFLHFPSLPIDTNVVALDAKGIGPEGDRYFVTRGMIRLPEDIPRTPMTN